MTKGKVHKCLGMTLDFSKNKWKVIIRMDCCLAEVIDEARDDMDGTAATPAAEHLFETGEDSKHLNEEDAKCFHTVTAKMLFVSKRARPELQQAIAFLSTQVKSPNKDNYKKLRRVMKCPRAERKLALTLEANDLQVRGAPRYEEPQGRKNDTW